MSKETQPKSLRAHIHDLANQTGIFEKAKAYYQNQLSFDLKSSDRVTESVIHKAEQVTWLYCVAITKPSISKQLGFPSKDEFYNVAIEEMQNEAREKGWKSWKCSTLKGLSGRLTPFHKAYLGKQSLESAFDTLLSKKVGNSNASKLGFEQQATIVLLHLEQGEKKYKKTFKLYTLRAAKMVDLGYWKRSESIVSLNAIRYFLKHPVISALTNSGSKLNLSQLIKL